MNRFVSPRVLVGLALAAGLLAMSGAPSPRALAQTLPSMPAQDCGGEETGSGVLVGYLPSQYLGSNQSLWSRATVAVFPTGNAGGLSYLQSIKQIVAPQNVASAAPNAEASAQALANQNTGINTALHFASIHQGGQYNGGFHCVGLASGNYTVVVTLYRAVPASQVAKNFANAGVLVDQTNPQMQGFTPTFFYEVPSVYVISGSPFPQHTGSWTFLGSHPYGYQ